MWRIFFLKNNMERKNEKKYEPYRPLYNKKEKRADACYTFSMDGFDINDNQGNNLNVFLKSYRDSLDRNYAASNMLLDRKRNNDMASIMAAANKRGMLYSNFPERSKIQYESDTYLPAKSSYFQTYQTGLDKLRSNAVNYYNQIKNLEDAIADLSA